MAKKVKKRESKTDSKLLKAQLVRALADYDNLQKRVEKERGTYRQVVASFLVAKLLPIVDMLEDSQDNLKDAGLAVALKEFYEVLKDEGAEKIEAKKGDMFDENEHEAVEAVDRGGKNGQIIEVLLSGWKIEDELVRPAKVKVVRKDK